MVDVLHGFLHVCHTIMRDGLIATRQAATPTVIDLDNLLQYEIIFLLNGFLLALQRVASSPVVGRVESVDHLDTPVVERADACLQGFCAHYLGDLLAMRFVISIG